MNRFATRRAVFLDRDGVLVRPVVRAGRRAAPRRLDEFEIMDNAATAVARLKSFGYLAIAATDQPDVGAGEMDRAVLREMHGRLAAETGLDAIEVSFSPREAPCRRRMPEPGMLVDAALAGRVDLSASWIVTTSADGVEAGRRAGCRTVLIDRGRAPASHGADRTVHSLAEAVDAILDPLGLRRSAAPKGARGRATGRVIPAAALAEARVRRRAARPSSADSGLRDPRL